MMKKNDYVLLAAALFSFLLFQGVLVYYTRVAEYDEAVFLDVARNIRRVGLPLRSMGADGVLYFIHTPLYLYVVTASTMLLGDNPVLTRLVTMAFGAGSIVLVYLTVRRRQTAVSGFIAAFLLAINTFIAIYAFFLTMAVPMMFFILLAVYWLAKDETAPARRYWFGAGMAVATAVMLKELALIFAAAAALYAFISGRTWQKRITQPLWLLLPTVAALALWSWWGFRLDPVQFQAGVERWLGFASGANNAAGSRGLQSIAWLQIMGDNVFSWGVITLFIAAIFAYLIWFRRKLPQIIWLLFLYLGLALGASFLISIKEPRHIIALVPVTAMIIGILVQWDVVWGWVRQKRSRTLLSAAVALLLIWQISPLKLPPTAQWRQAEQWWEPQFAQRIFHSQRYYSLLKETGEYLAENTPPDAVITVLHEGPVIAYYADRPHYFLYTMAYPDVMNRLEATQYLVVDDQLFFQLSPEEVGEVMAYVEAEFELDRLMQDQYRQTRIYHRKNGHRSESG
jgi:4-amino-4-deoxy-L-arabinose transferase-like glycosyltransferase